RLRTSCASRSRTRPVPTRSASTPRLATSPEPRLRASRSSRVTRRRVVGFNLGLATLGLILAVALGRELVRPQPLPEPAQLKLATAAAIAQVGGAPSQPQPDSSAMGDTSANRGSLADEVIASGNLFDPSRSSSGAAGEPTGPRPLLFGLVAGEGVKGRAYVEDPETKVVR